MLKGQPSQRAMMLFSFVLITFRRVEVTATWVIFMKAETKSSFTFGKASKTKAVMAASPYIL